MAVGFVRTDGNALNSGGGDTAAADITDDSGTGFVVVGGTALSFAAGGFSALTADSVSSTGYTRRINLQIAGVSTLRGITVLTDTTATLSAAVADGSYNGRIGGARALPSQMTSNASGNNATLATGDIIFVRTGTYTALVSLSATGTYYLQALGGFVTLDGTGGGAGSDVVTCTSGTWFVQGFLADNAVDTGFLRTGGGINLKLCKALDSGGRGFDPDSGEPLFDCVCIGAGGDAGIRGQGGTVLYRCWVSDCTNDGFDSRSVNTAEGCAFVDCGSDGVDAFESDGIRIFRNCLFAGNTGAGFAVTGGTQAGRLPAGSEFINCIFISNGTYGIDFGTTQTNAGRITMIGNCTFGNSTAARNAAPADLEGFVGLTSDPEFVDLTTDDVRLATGSPYIGAAYQWWPGNNVYNFGGAATEEGSAPAGGAGAFVPIGMTGGVRG